MPQVAITIGNRTFEVACQAGEEQYLQAAAAVLDSEAATLAQHMGRMPESQLLLMAGLMLADKHLAIEERLRKLEAGAPERIEVAVIPPQVTETLAELAARAEALADEVETRLP